MKVLVIPSWYPDENDKLLGIYHKEYATAISNNNIDIDMLYISRIGISKIFKYPFMMKKQIDNEKTYKVYCYQNYMWTTQTDVPGWTYTGNKREIK